MEPEQKQPMFYRNVVALSRERHKDWSVDMGRGYQFTSSTNSIYVAGTEFPMASREYPIVFSKDSLGTLVPVALLGVVQNQNLMLAETGAGSEPTFQLTFDVTRLSLPMRTVRRQVLPCVLTNRSQDLIPLATVLG
jgi:hypothetical protein